MDSEKSVAGRKTMKGPDGKKPRPLRASESALGKTSTNDPADLKSTTAAKSESKEDHEVETELNTILKKGPSQSNLSLLTCLHR